MGRIDITIIPPTLNEEKRIGRCLSSIRNQDYPQERVEIIVPDGGSEDKTTEIAKNYKARIMDNKRILGEFGLQQGVLSSEGRFVTAFAADNELYSRGWIKKVMKIFDNEDVSAVWGRLVSGNDDTSLNKYFELIQNDPFSNFMNKNLSVYLRTGEKRGDHFVFRVNPKYPLVWGANGLTYRKSLVRHYWDKNEYIGDNDVFQLMIESGNNKVAYFPGPFCYHHHVGKVGDWIRKWNRNFRKHFLDKRNSRNMNWIITKGFNIKLMFWFLYSLCPVVSFFDAVKNMIRDRNKYWLYHPMICFLQTCVYLNVMLTTKEGRDLLRSMLKKL